MCQYDITMYPFCGQGKEITCSLAATSDNTCRRYPFEGCRDFYATGIPCLKFRDFHSEAAFCRAVEGQRDTIVRVSFEDCNLGCHGALSCKMGLKKRATDRFDRPVGPPPERRRVRSHEKSAMKRWLSTVQKGSLDLTSRQMYESDGGSPEEYTCATP
ncbi:uncharacterized protein H6S33_010946 [Morchella sextelata]|uniref:uncharacterized protein n=1 Tax=Morchella sextelata TaxID=1174677 RepID=UPI001D05086E|nr:uncharacterized protein H6S33_010946 [Morchella sextelata]KAH0611681.1 hypothetical protein H6S33_010946 [Morchella sextelata]